jgi:hypothetical protein
MNAAAAASAEVLVQQGVAHLNVRRYEEAATAYLEALKTDQRAEQAWLGLAVTLALWGRPGDIIGLADHRQRLLGDGFLFCHAALGVLMNYRFFDAVREFAAIVPGTSRYAASAAYNAGCAALIQGDEDRAYAFFGRFKRHLADSQAAFPIGPNSLFNIAYRQGSLIEDRDYVRDLAGFEAVRRTLPEPVFETGSVGDGDTVIAACCDRPYFERFAPGLVASAARHLPGSTLHLHVIAPDESTQGRAAALASSAPEITLALSTEAAGPFHSGAYFASSRFLIGQALLERYRRRLVLVDVDIELLAPLDDLLAAVGDHDLAVFRHDGAGPCSRYPAVLTCWAPDERARDLLDRTGRFILSKLHIEWPHNWMLDQAALASIIRWAATERPNAAIAIANDVTGRNWDHWVRSVGGDEKAAMIRAAGQPG